MIKKMRNQCFMFVLALSLVLNSASVVFAANKDTMAAESKLTPKSIAVDTNKDGQPDRTEYYDDKGMLSKVEADSNQDGKSDEWGTVENGKITKVAKDTDYDGKADKWVTY